VLIEFNKKKIRMNLNLFLVLDKCANDNEEPADLSTMSSIERNLKKDTECYS
jgi:hypothetical protein